MEVKCTETSLSGSIPWLSGIYIGSVIEKTSVAVTGSFTYLGSLVLGSNNPIFCCHASQGTKASRARPCCRRQRRCPRPDNFASVNLAFSLASALTTNVSFPSIFYLFLFEEESKHSSQFKKNLNLCFSNSMSFHFAKTTVFFLPRFVSV